MQNTKVGQILTRLLAEEKIRVSELARRIKLPQPTIQRIAAGTCENPHVSSLQPIANYFSITIDQLKGLEAIPKFETVRKLPLISWKNAAKRNKKPTAYANKQIIVDITTSEHASEHAYALQVIDGAMEPIFPVDSILIVDPDVAPKDKSYVIALIHGKESPIFRQLLINGPDKYLKPLNPDINVYKMQALTRSDNILATVIQARWNYTG